MKLFSKLKYFVWAASRWHAASRICPACGSPETVELKRKALVTALYRCHNCQLMFRVPKDSLEENFNLYQTEYQQGFTTDCPDDETLARLKANHFHGTEKDYSTYLEVLTAADVKPGHVVVDFGSSWGYGSWQLAQSGLQVYSYEISVPRARYAAEKLGCQMLLDPAQIPVKADCFFSAHVIEHLPNPRLLWQAALSVLKPEGVVVLFMPNGDPAREGHEHYHQIWGQVHPLLMSVASLQVMADRFDFAGRAYTSPYDLNKVAAFAQESTFLGDELLFIARHR